MAGEDPIKTYMGRIEAAKKLCNEDVQASIEQCEVLVSELEGVDFPEVLFSALKALGEAQVVSGQYPHALLAFQRCIKVIPSPKSALKLWQALNAIAVAQNHMGQLSEAIQTLKKASSYVDKTGSAVNKAVLQINISNIYHKQNDNLKCRDYLEKALGILRGTDDYKTLALCLINLGSVNNLLQDFQTALTLLNEAVSLTEEHKLDYFNTVLFKERGLVYESLGMPELALKNYSRAIELSLKLKAYAQGAEALLSRSLFFSQQQYLKAQEDLDHAKQLVDTIGDLNLQCKTYKQAWAFYKELGEWRKALEAHEIYTGHYNNLISSESKAKMASLELSELQKAQDQLFTISAIGQKITAELDLDSVLQLIYEKINDLIDAYAFGIGTYQQETQKIGYEFFIENGKRKPKIFTQLDSGTSLASWVIEHRQPAIVQDLEDDLATYGLNSLASSSESEDESSRVQSILYFPLITGSQVIGFMTVQSQVKRAYSLVDINLVQALSVYVAISFNNAQQAKLIQEKNEELKQKSETDALTKLYNRHYLMQELPRLWSWTARASQSFALLLLDVDHFKSINDTYGHLVGDTCLVELAVVIQRQVNRETDTVARYGGEEFAILLAGTDESNAYAIAEQVRTAVQDHEVLTGDLRLRISVSIGVVAVDPHKSKRNMDAVFSAADDALYEAKRAGRNRVVVGSHVNMVS